VLVARLCLILCDCSLQASSVRGILQASVLKWVAVSFSRGSSRLVVASLDRRRIYAWVSSPKNFRELLGLPWWLSW